jgi:metallophosphoesterase (TIGR00282 family)
MRILILGDIVGRTAREMVIAQLPTLRRQHRLDAIVVNADNASGGFGLKPEHAEALIQAGADAITCGDHVWDQKELRPLLASNPRLVRPINFPSNTPGKGEALVTLANGEKLLVLHALGQVFIQDHLDSPFTALDHALNRYRLGATVQAILVDFHAEATSEKMAMGHFLDGRVSAVVGSHTHVPTADACIRQHGTAYLTDLGMCGNYDSVIGFDVAAPLTIFTQKIRKTRLLPANDGPATLRGAIIETERKTGLAKTIEPFSL